jgi:exodeoxyribonuclease VII small subunit
MTAKTRKEPIEKSLEKLEQIVAALEAGNKGLEESLKLFEEGIVLTQVLTKELKEARHAVEVMVSEGGKLSRRPLKEEEPS